MNPYSSGKTRTKIAIDTKKGRKKIQQLITNRSVQTYTNNLFYMKNIITRTNNFVFPPPPSLLPMPDADGK